jgi:serine/threonine protein kinase
MFEKIMKAELTFPHNMPADTRDLLSRLLVRDPSKRMGSGEKDATELKEHAFFKGVDWDALSKGEVPAPWVPTVAGLLDTSQFDQEFTSMNPIVSPDVREAYFGSVDRQFEGFSFVDDSGSSHHMMGSSMTGSMTGSMSGASATMAASLKFGR